MKDKKLAGAVLATCGGSLAILLLATQKGFSELPTLPIMISSLLVMTIGMLMVIRADLKK